MLNIGKIVRIVVGGTITILLLFVLFNLTGCGHLKPVVTTTPSHTERTDSTNTRYIHDTTYIDRWHTRYQRGDTVFLHDSVYVFQGKEKADTVYVARQITDTITNIVEVEQQLTKNQQFLIRSGIACWVILALLLLAVIVGIVLKFAK